MATQTTVTKPQTKAATKPATKAPAKAAQKPVVKAEQAAKPTQAKVIKNAVAHSAIAALDSATQSGGFFSRAIEYHMGKGNLQVKKEGTVIYYALKGAKLIERIKDAALMDAVKASRENGKSVHGKAFIKAPAGSPCKYTIAEPCEGGKVSQAFFSSLFA